MKRDTKIVILGAGLSGLSAAHGLKKDYEIFEKEDTPGGLCRSRTCSSFTFDIAGHLLHFKEKKNFALIKDFLASNMREQERKSWIWSHERFIPYPFQSHFDKLPSRVASECLRGYQKATERKRGASDLDGLSFRTWILRTFGTGIAKHFMFPYNEKFWKFPLECLDHRWADPWIPRFPAKGYNARFWYPRRGGIQALPDAFAKRVKRIHTRFAAVRIDLDKKEVLFGNGSRIKYKQMISTIPLPELAGLLTPVPREVRKAFKKLKYTSLFNVNLGLTKEIDDDKHWVYFPQKDISFYRWGVTTNFSRAMAPAGHSSVYFEVSYTKEHPINKKTVLNRILTDCRKAHLAFSRKDVSVIDTNDIKYAYCLYDRQRDQALSVIQPFLKSRGIFSIGRYGGWRYASMEDVMTEAKDTADILRGGSVK